MMGKTKCNYSKFSNGRQVFYDGSTDETLVPMYPVVVNDDFLGEAYNGVMGLGLDNTDEAQIAAMHFGDNLCLSMAQGLIFETRLTFNVLPTTGTEAVNAVFGLASAHKCMPSGAGKIKPKEG